MAVPPTTIYETAMPDRSPCCDARLVLTSPPLGYECRECMREFNLADGTEQGERETDDDADTCPVELTSGERAGEVCGRDRPCRFHDD